MKSILGILALMFTVSANAETNFWGFEVMNCAPNTVSTLAQKESGSNRLNVINNKSFICEADDGQYLLEISELVLGLKITGAKAINEISVSCRPASEDFTFAGKYRFFGIGLGFGYGGFYGQAQKAQAPGQRDCIVSIRADETLEAAISSGSITVTPFN